MGRRISSLLTVAAILGMAACGEPQNVSPSAPSFAASAPVSTLSCNFTTLSRLTTHYFGGQEAKAVKAILDAMQTAGPTSATGRNLGFDVMVHISQNIKAGNTDAADAASLTNNLLVCMYTDPADLPLTFPEDFSVATDPAQHGGYEVRGGTADLTDPVLSRPLSAPFSGIAPTGVNTWPDVLGGNTAPARILAYGKPGPDPLTYDWKIVPRSTVFSPPVMVGVCVDPNVATTSLIVEEHKGLLPFVDVPFLVPGSCSSVATTQSWPTQFARRLEKWGANVFLPRSLSAAVMNPGGLGGSTGGIGSIFGPTQVATVTLTFTVQPTDVTVNQIITPAVVVQATVPGTSTPIPNVQITLSSRNNNGTPAQLLGTLTGITDASGTVTFSDLSQTKTGGYLLVATGAVIGRPAIQVPEFLSDRYNVRP
jgi:hypothetical protein